MRSIAANVQSYEQMVEVCSDCFLCLSMKFLTCPKKQLLAFLTPGGLLHLSFGLFHQHEAIRETTVDILNELRQYPVSSLFLIRSSSDDLTLPNLGWRSVLAITKPFSTICLCEAGPCSRDKVVERTAETLPSSRASFSEFKNPI